MCTRYLLAAAGLAAWLPVADAGHLIRDRYDGSMDAGGARTTSWRDFLANQFVLSGGFPNSQYVAIDEAEIPPTANYDPAGNIEDFGSFVRGYFVAPMDGDYTLTVGSDDSSGLWVSGNHTIPGDFPSKDSVNYREPDAEETNWTNGDLFSAARLDERTTGILSLTKGQVIYFEIVSQEGGGGDFIRLGWTRPDAVQEFIPGDYLIPYEAPGTGLTLADGEFTLLGAQRPAGNPADLTVPEAGAASFKVDVFGGTAPYTFQWSENGTPMAGETLPSIAFDKVTLSQNGNAYTCQVRDGAGTTITSAGATLTVQADTAGPVIVSAAGSGEPHGIIVTYDEAVDPTTAQEAANYALTGQTVTINAATLLAENQVLLDVTEFNTDVMTLTVNNVKDTSAAGNPIAPNSTAQIIPAVLSYRDLVLNDGADAYWPMDEQEGTTVENLATPSWSGTLNSAVGGNLPILGAAGLVPNVPGASAIQFVAAEENRVNIPDNALLNQGGPYVVKTIELWFRPDALPRVTDGSPERAFLFEQGGNTRGLDIYLSGTEDTADPSTAEIHFHAWNDANDDSNATSPWGGPESESKTPVIVIGTVEKAQRYHVVLVMDGDSAGFNGELRGYINGVEVGTAPGVGRFFNASDDAAFGGIRQNAVVKETNRAVGNGDPFEGVIDEASYYNAALTAEQVATHYAQGMLPPDQNPPLAGPLSFTEEPQSQTVAQNRDATFTAQATGSPDRIIGYQWYRDGTAIEGATANTYTLVGALLSDNGAVFHVEAFNTDGTFARIASADATLTVVDDQDPPALDAVAALAMPINRIDLVFNETLDEASATNAANYSIDGVTVNSATLAADGVTVSLSTSDLTDGVVYAVVVDGVADLVGNVATFTQEVTATIDYRDLVLSDGPDAYWPFNELEGTDVNNLVDPAWVANINSGNGGALPVLGTFGIVQNLDDTAIGFVAAEGNRVRIPDHPLLNAKSPNDGYEEKTIELWFRANALPARPTGGDPERAFLFEQGGTTRGISLYLSGTQDSADPTTAEIHFNAWNDSNQGPGAWGGPESEDPAKPVIVIKDGVEKGKTYHAVLVMDGDPTGFTGEVRGYLNGVGVGTTPGVGLFFNAGDDAGVGAINQNSVVKETNRSTGYGDPFDGIIDEVAYYNTALTPDQIAAHYNQGILPGPVPSVERLSPAQGAIGVQAEDGIELVLKDQQTTVDPASITMVINGLAVTPDINQNAGLTTISYTATDYPSQATITVDVGWANNEGTTDSFRWNFTSILLLPEAWAVAPGTGSDPGFKLRSEQVFVAPGDPNLPNSVARAEAQLGTPPEPLSDFSGTANLDVINLSHNDFTDNGYFTGLTTPFDPQNADQGFGDTTVGLTDPGFAPPDFADPNTNNFSIEAVFYLELQPGVVELGVNSDDGFRLTAGRVPEEPSLELGVHDGGRGITAGTPQSPAVFKVTKAGVYAFRLIYFQGGGGAGLELHVKDSSGTTHLLNGTGSPITAYRVRGQDPTIVAGPTELAITSDGANVSISFATVDGATYEVQATDDLAVPAWQPVATIIGDGNVATVMDAIVDSRSYRVETKWQ